MHVGYLLWIINFRQIQENNNNYIILNTKVSINWHSQLWCYDWMYSIVKICLLVSCVWCFLYLLKFFIKLPGVWSFLWKLTFISYAVSFQHCIWKFLILQKAVKTVALRPVAERFSWCFLLCFPLYMLTIIWREESLAAVSWSHFGRKCDTVLTRNSERVPVGRGERVRERQRQRQKDRERKRNTERDIETDRETHMDAHRETDRKSQTEIERQTKINIEGIYILLF